MGIVRRYALRTGTRAVLFIVAVLAASLFLGQHEGRAADLRMGMVTGIVKSVSATELDVDGRTYNIAGVPLRTATGKSVSPAEILPGTKVDLYFRGQKIMFVHVYPYKMVE